VELTYSSKDEFLTTHARANRANALAAAGDILASRRLFIEAEALQAKLQPEYPRLYSLSGNNYCDFLLSENNFVEVLDRAKSALKLMGSDARVLDLGFDNVSLGRGTLGLALSATTLADAASARRESCEHLETAIAELRRSSVETYIPLGHLARARLLRALGDFPASRRDLDEVLEIAEPGPMRLHLCDMHLELCRLALAELHGFAPLAPTSLAPSKDAESLKQKAKEELAAAAKFIEDCGYHKRDAERDELAEVIEGKRQLRDLTIRV
jgi:hypothetical protein